MVIRKPRIGRASETGFATLCSDAGVVAQAVTEDENGWDYLVEISNAGYTGPADEQPAWKTIYVQVKSTTNDRPIIPELTLSNARKMAQHPSAWFLVLYHRPKSGPPRIYARHVWTEFIERALREVKRADVKGKKLNKHRLNITLNSEDDHGQGIDLIEWMERVVHSYEPNYSHKKEKIYTTTGREKGYGKAKVKISAGSQVDLDKTMLGIGNVAIESFEFVPERFGIIDSRNILSLKGGLLSLEQIHLPFGIIKFRKPGSIETISCSGKVYFNPLNNAELILRIQASYVQLLLRRDGNQIFTFRLEEDVDYNLKEYSDFARINSWIYSFGVEVSILLDGKTVAKGTLKGTSTRSDDWLELSDATMKWNILTGETLRLLPADYESITRNVVMMHQCVTSHHLAVEAKYKNEHFLNAKKIVYTCGIDIGGQCLQILMERKTKSIIQNDDNIRLVFGEGVLIDILSGSNLYINEEKFSEIIDSYNETVVGIYDVVAQLIKYKTEFKYYIHVPDESS